MAELTPPIALVTGANRGIGREVARQLAECGMTVILGARDDAKGAEAAAAVTGLGGNAYPLALDVADPASIASAAAWLTTQLGRLDVLVNNAAVHYDTWQRASNPDFAVVEEALAVNMLGAWCRLACRCSAGAHTHGSSTSRAGLAPWPSSLVRRRPTASRRPHSTP